LATQLLIGQTNRLDAEDDQVCSNKEIGRTTKARKRQDFLRGKRKRGLLQCTDDLADLRKKTVGEFTSVVNWKKNDNAQKAVDEATRKCAMV